VLELDDAGEEELLGLAAVGPTIDLGGADWCARSVATRAGHRRCGPLPATLLCAFACSVPACTDPPAEEYNVKGYNKDKKARRMSGTSVCKNMSLRMKQRLPLTRAGAEVSMSKALHHFCTTSTLQEQILRQTEVHVLAAHAVGLPVLVVAVQIDLVCRQVCADWHSTSNDAKKGCRYRAAAVVSGQEAERKIVRLVKLSRPATSGGHSLRLPSVSHAHESACTAPVSGGLACPSVRCPACWQTRTCRDAPASLLSDTQG